MAVTWEPQERAEIEVGIRRHPLASGRCAALARVVYRVGKPRDEATRGRQVRPLRRSAARYVVPRTPHPPLWGSHTLTETQEHGVDGLTGVEGCAASEYLARHWLYAEALEVHDVDVFSVDQNIEADE
ncbi:MAG: hypothetical protein IT373_24945 [Polyangiaceae bacterium]|nr:hypothetical protein [Polyangiaceae bacterium]